MLLELAHHPSPAEELIVGGEHADTSSTASSKVVRTAAHGVVKSRRRLRRTRRRDGCGRLDANADVVEIGNLETKDPVVEAVAGPIAEDGQSEPPDDAAAGRWVHSAAEFATSTKRQANGRNGMADTNGGGRTGRVTTADPAQHATFETAVEAVSDGGVATVAAPSTTTRTRFRRHATPAAKLRDLFSDGRRNGDNAVSNAAENAVDNASDAVSAKTSKAGEDAPGADPAVVVPGVAASSKDPSTKPTAGGSRDDEAHSRVSDLIAAAGLKKP